MLSTKVPKPGRSLYGPSCPQPETRTITSRGLRLCSSAGPSPIFSSVPGRKFSISTSAVAIRSVKISRPRGGRRLSATLFLLRA